MKRRFDIGDRFCLLLAGEGSTFLVLLERLENLMNAKCSQKLARRIYSNDLAFAFVEELEFVFR